MRRLKRYGLILVVFCMAGLFAGCSNFSDFIENSEEAKERKETARHADSVNTHGFIIVFDGDEIDVNAKMSESMHLLIPIEETIECFSVQIMLGQGTLGYVNGVPVENLIIREKKGDLEIIWVNITLLSSALDMECEWNDSAYIMKIASEENPVLPEHYDLRDFKNLNPVQDQGEFGTCWAFAAVSALEMMSSVDEGVRFSVDHMTMNNGFNISPEEGGDYNMAIAYLSAWQGPVSENEDPYGDAKTDSSLHAEKHLQEVQILKEKDINKIKQMIMTYGGVESPIYMSIFHAGDQSDEYEPSNSAYYYFGDQEANHDVVIVGWDDHFKKENFNRMPKNDGAFICRNSWGEIFGQSGYFYVSYEDAVLGEQSIVYTRLENPDNYSRIYQSDMLGWIGTLGYGEESAWFSNVYTAVSDEVLKAVSFYAVDNDSKYDLYVVSDYTNTEDLSKGNYMGSGYCEESGYYTINLPEGVALNAGEDFAIVMYVTTDGCERPIAIEYNASELTQGVNIDDGKGYVSYDGVTWMSSEQEYDCNICLKAFTD